MYIFEEITKFLNGKKYKPDVKTDYTPSDGEDLLENPNECEHLFMPLDSSGEYYACKYCGLVVSKDKLKEQQ
ncbi:MAG TPA: hypothetical protein DEO94_06910 [Cyanobacteria bacterium UBA11991]|nr:hypothetical protein [Cyanobacteriota bacterium]MDY6357959.1 hypothetical protein [Cyanobacteriota bacterium]MDY6364252.1 hypothetical protein [Cyanobacteriota bacterium]MDY6383448.1 hypothetical protein [Cyanobacteriota bacterium]HCB11838.1 hypothetical protein [Cyanobacteria bacterium UBA11991]